MNLRKIAATSGLMIALNGCASIQLNNIPYINRIIKPPNREATVKQQDRTYNLEQRARQSRKEDPWDRARRILKGKTPEFFTTDSKPGYIATKKEDGAAVIMGLAPILCGRLKKIKVTGDINNYRIEYFGYTLGCERNYIGNYLKEADMNHDGVATMKELFIYENKEMERVAREYLENSRKNEKKSP